MNEELRHKIEVFNRKARAAKRDGYAVMSGEVYKPDPEWKYGWVKVCDVDDYLCEDEAELISRAANAAANVVAFTGAEVDWEIHADKLYEELMEQWGWTFEQCTDHRELCAKMARGSA